MTPYEKARRRKLIKQAHRRHTSAHIVIGDVSRWMNYAERQLTVHPKHFFKQADIDLWDMGDCWSRGEGVALTDTSTAIRNYADRRNFLRRNKL